MLRNPLTTTYLRMRLMVINPVGVEKLARWRQFWAVGIFLRGCRAFFFYLRSKPWLILEILILGSELVVSSFAL